MKSRLHFTLTPALHAAAGDLFADVGVDIWGLGTALVNGKAVGDFSKGILLKDSSGEPGL